MGRVSILQHLFESFVCLKIANRLALFGANLLARLGRLLLPAASRQAACNNGEYR
jgi:hypothetical protein